MAEADTVLVKLHEHANYGGTSAEVKGAYGTCDTAGYRLELNTLWSNIISSAEGRGWCNYATYTNRNRDYAESHFLPTPSFGARLNDNVGIIDVRYR
ncbi:hypothetical protein B0I31_107224 [Saccharothrix carnea]|uniref:Beta/gamma crystallin n=1 Tax=Saccharothrix carnea TaxID=1280637 RepID=A0A2P8I6S3_SACCR|nr:hypothetical protein B0I31_107224 [Saccharothrix carnea]